MAETIGMMEPERSVPNLPVFSSVPRPVMQCGVRGELKATNLLTVSQDAASALVSLAKLRSFGPIDLIFSKGGADMRDLASCILGEREC